MSDNSKTSAPSASSLIDLKAELFRKQEEFKKQKFDSSNAAFIKGKSSTITKKPSVWSRKNVGVLQRAQQDQEEKQEEENILDKSKKSLEGKARLYEQMRHGHDIPEEDGSGLYLVDFQKKHIDDVFEMRERQRREEEEREKREMEEERQQLLQPVPKPSSQEDQWVDYTDSLGRSRRCLKKDLPDLQKLDRSHGNKSRLDGSRSLMSDDMIREAERESWEQAEQEKMEAEMAGPIHYANVRHNEVRSHGVGFYEFDKDEAVRQEQLAKLTELRKQTVEERSKRDRIKEKRKAMMEARLAKVRQRKKLKGGYTEDETESKEEDDLEETAAEDVGPKLPDNIVTPTEAKTNSGVTQRGEDRLKTAPVREWDIGKEELLARSGEKWLKERREERPQEFAPPNMYFDSSEPQNQLKQNSGYKQKSLFKKEVKTETDRIETPLKYGTGSGGVGNSKEAGLSSDVGSHLGGATNNTGAPNKSDSHRNNRTDVQEFNAEKDITESYNPADYSQQSWQTFHPSYTQYQPPFNAYQPPPGVPPFTVPPPDISVPPPGNMAPPPGNMAPPPGNIVPPHSNIVPPPGNIVTPPGNIAPPSGSLAPPLSNVAPPTGNIAPPANSTVPLPQLTVPPPQLTVPPPPFTLLFQPPPPPPPATQAVCKSTVVGQGNQLLTSPMVAGQYTGNTGTQQSAAVTFTKSQPGVPASLPSSFQVTQTSGAVSAAPVIVGKPEVVVARETIIDRRLMQNADSD